MKKDMLGPAALFVFVLAAFPVSFISSSHAESAAASEEARTLQMIAPYRTWGKANVQPIIVSTDRMAPSGWSLRFDIGDVSEQRPKKGKPKQDQQSNVHQTIFGAVYLNEIARTTFPQSQPFIYPEGAVIVREKLKTEVGSPELLTAMIKRKNGFNPEANDWEFLIISGDATKIKKRQKTGACQSCHASVSKNDFVFDNYLQ